MKPGIDFFPLDVALDEKWELIEAEFGLTGFSVVVKLLQRIYGGQGYYCEWTNEVALLFAKKIGLGGSVVSEIASASIKRGIFDKTLYDEYGILTSVGIQKRYFEAVSRRKSVKVDLRYLLVPYAQNFENDNKNEKNVDIFSKNDDIFEQSKVEKSKVKYNPPIPPQGGDGAESAETMFEKFWKAYPKKVDKKGSEKAFKNIKNICEEFEKIMAALERQKHSEQWNKDGGQYIPHPKTWLNQERWNDQNAAQRIGSFGYYSNSSFDPEEAFQNALERSRRAAEKC